MNAYLRKIDLEMGELEYDMYQEIPKEEIGEENDANGLSYKQFRDFLLMKMAEENQELNEITTPRINYIMYVNDYPVGDIAIRPKLNDYWKKYSGNIGYKIRPSERKKGYGKLMLGLALENARKIGLTEVLLQCNNQNLFSKAVIESNGGCLITDDGKSFKYAIKL